MIVFASEKATMKIELASFDFHGKVILSYGDSSNRSTAFNIQSAKYDLTMHGHRGIFDARLVNQ